MGYFVRSNLSLIHIICPDKGWTNTQINYLLDIQWITIILDLLINILTYIEYSASRAQNFLNFMQYAF